MALTAKQRRFVAEYLTDLNAKQAAIRAGYTVRRAEVTGCELLQNRKVSEAVAEEMKKREGRTQVTQDRVLAEYAKLAFLDPRAFFDANGHLIDIHKLPAEVAAAMAGMDIATERTGEDDEGRPVYGQVRKVKFADKKGALDSVARHLGMFTDRTELTGKDGGPVKTESQVTVYIPSNGRG